jgi:predicted phosphate transport protein (TIGR00153 family)
MALGSFLKLFMPKDRVFYSLFEEVTGNLKQMSEVFMRALNEQNRSERDRLLRSLEDLEHRNDEVTHRIFIELGRNFITPFDREDIHTLTTSLDDVADYMWGSAKRILNYQIDEIDETMQTFGTIIDKCIAAIHGAIHELRDMKKIRAITDACVAINKLENDADDVFDRATVMLFSTHNISAVELIKRKDLYQEMEIVTDKCEDAANVIESIIIKYA